MNKRHKLIATAIILALPTLTLMKSASAHPPGPCMDHGGLSGHPGALFGMPLAPRVGQMFRMLEPLDLTRTQREKIREILDEQRPQVRNRVELAFKGRQQLINYDTVASGEDGLRKLADAQAKTMSELFFLLKQTRSRIRSVLTPEQQDKLAAQIAQRHGKPPRQ
ncbi:MAG: Spy/CpxP family protein refolding chaperone [Pseudomonadota bacterium]